MRPVEIAIARELVTRYHYAKGASNTRTYLHGLFRRGAFWEADCVGIAWWIPPTRSAAEATFPKNWQGVLALSRLVVAPEVPKNACSFLLSRSVKLIPADEWPCLVTYADDWRGHTGTIYRACNWKYLGKTGVEDTYTINGVMTSRKAGGHTRTKAEMIALGALNEGRHAKHKYVLIRERSGRTSTAVAGTSTPSVTSNSADAAVTDPEHTDSAPVDDADSHPGAEQPRGTGEHQEPESPAA